MVKMAGSNQGASSAYTEAGPPEMMMALRKGGSRNPGDRGGRSGAASSPVALLSDGEGRRLQREDLGADAQLPDPPVDHLTVLGPGIQDGHGPLARPVLLGAADLQLRGGHKQSQDGRRRRRWDSGD